MPIDWMIIIYICEIISLSMKFMSRYRDWLICLFEKNVGLHCVKHCMWINELDTWNILTRVLMEINCWIKLFSNLIYWLVYVILTWWITYIANGEFWMINNEKKLWISSGIIGIIQGTNDSN